MRISDWSSDVCSSDLPLVARADRAMPIPVRQEIAAGQPPEAGTKRFQDRHRIGAPAMDIVGRHQRRDRSEEHTSELQSLMRISYAVFCLKKKKPKTKEENHKIQHNNTRQLYTTIRHITSCKIQTHTAINNN